MSERGDNIGGWIAIAIFFGLLIVGGTHSQAISPYGSYQEQRQPQGYQDANNGQNVSDQPSVSKPGIQIECDPNCAAQEGQHSAKEGAVARLFRKTIDDPLTLFTFILACATLILAIYTAVVATATKAAAEHIPRVERAYLFSLVKGRDDLEQGISLASVVATADNLDKIFDRKLRVTLEFENQGKTTAIIKTVSAVMELWTVLPAVPTYTPSLELLPDNRFMAPQEETYSREVALNRSLFTFRTAKALKANETFVWFYGRIVYDDVFEQEHEHRFIWRYSSSGFLPYYGNPEYVKNT